MALAAAVEIFAANQDHKVEAVAEADLVAAAKVVDAVKAAADMAAVAATKAKRNTRNTIDTQLIIPHHCAGLLVYGKYEVGYQ